MRIRLDLFDNLRAVENRLYTKKRMARKDATQGTVASCHGFISGTITQQTTVTIQVMDDYEN